MQNSSFKMQNSSFLMQNSSFLMQNSSFLMQNSSCLAPVVGGEAALADRHQPRGHLAAEATVWHLLSISFSIKSIIF